ncbi:MAG: S8 family serine peptidase [bacterium]|nr:S8 family serine peptidase [bacterium]
MQGISSGHLRSLICPALTLLCVVGWTGPAASQETDSPADIRVVIVKFHNEGEHAVTACAETLNRSRSPFRAFTSDDSDSIDRLHHRLKPRKIRALFRRPDGRPFSVQRNLLRSRLATRARVATVPDLSAIYAIEFPDAARAEAALASYRKDPHVEYAQPNYRVSANYEPDDPYRFSSNSWGQGYEDLWGLTLISAHAAWQESLGEDIVVAVVDTGVNYDHPDLQENMWLNPGEDLDRDGVVDPEDLNGIDDDGNGFADDLYGFDFHNSSAGCQADDGFDPNVRCDSDPFDDHGHGTHVSGTVAAVGNNGIGVIGVAPGAKIMAIKGLGAGGSGTIEALARGIVYAAENGALVINNSWSCGSRCPSNPLAEDAVRTATALGVTLVFSAGNRRDDPVFFSPQNLRETLVVSASTQDDVPTSFTNRGLLVDVAAPGGGLDRAPPGFAPTRNILSLNASNSSFNTPVGPANRYLRLAGTSMSAPHVAGLAALIRSHHPEFTREQVRRVIRDSADDLGEPGHDPFFGAGRINASRALTMDSPSEVFGAIDLPRLGNPLDPIEIRGSAEGRDLVSYALSYGAGLAPDHFFPIGSASPEPIRDGVLAIWDASELPPGPYTVRLSLESSDGEEFYEFDLISLDSNLPSMISSPGAAALQPAISGSLVVWRSARSTGEEDQEQKLFVTDLDDGVEYPVSASPEREHSASIDGLRIAWLEGKAASGGEIRTCLFDRSPSGCSARNVAPFQITFGTPFVTNNTVLWTNYDPPGYPQIFSCALRPGRACTGPPLAPFDSLQFQPRRYGKRLIWNDSRFAPLAIDIYTCEPDSPEGCVPRRIAADSDSAGFPLLSSRPKPLLAYKQFRPPELRICEVDFENAICQPMLISQLDRNDTHPDPFHDISGNTVVWNDSQGGAATDLFFCEYEARNGTCPVQRLTASFDDQSHARIEGKRVVWQDSREGIPRIAVFDLPSLEPLRDRTANSAELLRVRVTGHPGSLKSIALSATQIDAEPLSALGAKFEDFGNGTGTFSWVPNRTQAGRHEISFTGETPGKLKSRATISIEVVPVNHPPRARVPRWRMARVGKSVHLNGCHSFDRDGDELSFSWRDRRGRILGSGCRLTHTQDRPGLERLWLIVSDGQSHDTAQMRILWRRHRRIAQRSAAPLY